MAKRKKDLGIAKPAGALVGGAVILGAGGSVVGAIPGTTAATAGGGLTAMASFMPVAGTAIGAGLTIQQLKKLEKQTKRRR